MNGMLITMTTMTIILVGYSTHRMRKRRLVKFPVAISRVVVIVSSVIVLSYVLFSSIHAASAAAAAAPTATTEHQHGHHCDQNMKTANQEYGEIGIATSIDGSSSSSSISSSLNLMILSEPSPVTYMSGQSARFRSLLEYLSRHQNITGDSTVLVTSATNFNDEVDGDRDDGNLQKKALPTSCYDDTIPIEYTWGFRLPQYPALTLGVDIQHKIWRLCRRGIEVDSKIHICDVEEAPANQKRQQQQQHQRHQRQRRNFDLIHVSTPGLLVLPAIVSSRMHGIPLVMSYHTHLPSYIPIYFEKWPKIFQKFLTWLSWRLIIGAHKMFGHMTVVTSSQIANDFYNHGYTDNKSLVVWPKGVNTTQFHPRYRDETMRRRMLGLHSAESNEVNVNSNGRNSTSDTDGSKTLLLVYIGRLGKEKRLKDLKPILEQLQKRIDESVISRKGGGGDSGRRRGPDSVHLCIVGSGPHEEELHQYFEGTNTTFLGSLEGMPLSQAYASADVFVMPSDTETLGFVVMEAMASSTPVVGCAAGGLLDLVHDESTGMLVPTGDINGFVEKIWMLSQDEKLYHRLAYNALEASKQWSWESSMEFMRRKVYPDVIRRFRQNNRWWPLRAFRTDRQKEA